MSDSIAASYDAIPYEAWPQRPTHPDCLATVATLFGLQPAPVECCRVLELGCATGGNLLAMAQTLPGSTFLGIDLSAGQVRAGQQVSAALGLTNIELRADSILAVDDSWGKFDYIIAHGVYSWVPPAVQDKILTICARNLAPAGVAYVSYNTYPGWHGRQVVREMLAYRVRQQSDPEQRVRLAREFLDFLAGAAPAKEQAYQHVLQAEAKLVRGEADSYVYHEHLEDENHPLYFHEFITRARQHSLQYLGEAWHHTRTDDLPADVQQTLRSLAGNLLELEQYVDFVRNRTFRRTLLCHDAVTLNRAPSVTTLRALHLRALARPVSEAPDVDSTEVEEFENDTHTRASINVPVLKAALVELYQAWPASLPFEELWQRVSRRLGEKAQPGPEWLVKALLQGYLTQMVSLHVSAIPLVTEVTPCPRAAPLARYQAAQGQARLASLCHRLVEVSPFDRQLVTLLDGATDHATLVKALAARLQQDRESVAQALPEALRRLAQNSLLAG